MSEYDICIIAVPRDLAMAEKLADSLRRYALPSGVELTEPGADYRRVTVDAVESLPGEKARRLLDGSRFLVVLCSPEVRTHPGILERLSYFRQSHESDHVIAVLAEGEPVDSFPENFTEEKLVKHIMPDMSVVERMEKIEPIAADLRGDTPSRRRKALRYETVRIAASVLGLHPDALEQRHRTRRRRAVTALLALVAAVCLTAAGLFIRLGLIARAEGDVAREQARLSAGIARRTIQELPQRFAGNEQALEYINEAIDNARADLEELGLSDLLSDAPSEGGG